MLTPLPLPDGELRYDERFLDGLEADRLFARLRAELAWEVHAVRIFGRVIPAPRLSAWHGNPGARYTYSGLTLAPRPWTPALAEVRAAVEQAVGLRFDAALANLYRDGADGMGWHSDDEPELGPAPVIASVSLGAVRRFVLRHRRRAHPALALPLAHGSLLVMQGETQRNWRHALPKVTAKGGAAVGPRINLTFRRILARRAEVR
jgi:alkylated DNA repair dioxygenase AlkB